MQIGRHSLLLALLLCMSVGCDSCGKPKPNATSGTSCDNKSCNVVVHVSSECFPVPDGTTDANGETTANPGDRICYFNDTGHSVTLSFHTDLISAPAVPSAPYQEFTLTAGACASFVVTGNKHKGDKSEYTIGGPGCPTSGGHGNPDVIIGGGSEGRGGGG